MFANRPTGCLQWPAASSCGPSHSSAVGSEQTSGSVHRYGSGGTWCWRQGCQLLSHARQCVHTIIIIIIFNPVILTTLPHGRQSHPTSHILRIPGSHCDSQIMIIPPLTVCLIIFFQSSSHVLHLPQQYWCFPSCHSHRGEQSRQAGEKEQPGFV